MTAQTTPLQAGGWLRAILPAPWLSLLNLIIFIGTLSMVAFAGHLDGDAAGQLIWIKGWAIAAAGWWLLMGARLCGVVHRMIPMRVPGIGRTLWRGVLVNLVFSIGLPAVALLCWQPAGADIPALIAALWLGSAAGLLILSVPAVFPIVPVLIVAMDWNAMASPWFSGLTGSAALLTSGLLWRWHLGPFRSDAMTPFGAAIDGMPVFIKTFGLPRPPPSFSRTPAPVSRASPSLRSRDLLAAMLGPGCQTLRQACGQRMRWFLYLLFAGLTVAMTSVVTTDITFLRSTAKPGSGIFFLAAMVAALVLAVERPAFTLATARRMRGARWTAAFLTPRMPPREALDATLMRQMSMCLAERIVLMGVVLPSCLNLVAPLNASSLRWWTCFCLLLLLQGLGSAWFAWVGSRRDGVWTGLCTVSLAMGIASIIWLARNDSALPTEWMALWAGLVVLMLGRLGASWRRSRSMPLGLHG